jgi:hypothetical protein
LFTDELPPADIAEPSPRQYVTRGM